MFNKAPAANPFGDYYDPAQDWNSDGRLDAGDTWQGQQPDWEQAASQFLGAINQQQQQPQVRMPGLPDPGDPGVPNLPSPVKADMPQSLIWRLLVDGRGRSSLKRRGALASTRRLLCLCGSRKAAEVPTLVYGGPRCRRVSGQGITPGGRGRLCRSTARSRRPSADTPGGRWAT